MDVRTDPAERILETVRIRRDRRVGTVANYAMRDRGPSADQVDRCEGLFHRIDQDFAAAIVHVGVVDPVQEDAVVCQAGVITKHQSTPVTRLGILTRTVAITTDRVIVV